MSKHTLTGLVAALALTSLPAVAADNGIYLGASVGEGGVQVDDIHFDASSTSYKLIAGWRFLDWLSVEGNYVGLGTADEKVDGRKVESDVSGVSLSAVGFVPIGPVDLFARVGAIDWSADLSTEGFGKDSEDGTDLTYGVGAQFRVWSLGIRAEYEVFDIEHADVDMISVGVTWTFL
jgi:hypothetical protein